MTNSNTHTPIWPTMFTIEKTQKAVVTLRSNLSPGIGKFKADTPKIWPEHYPQRNGSYCVYFFLTPEVLKVFFSKFRAFL